MVQEIRDLTELFTWTQPGTFAELLTSRPVGDALGRSRAPLRRAGLERQRRLPALPDGTRAGLLQRAALLVSSLEQTNPFHRGAFVRRSILCDTLPQPDPNSSAARLARSAAAEHGDDHAPALRRPRSRATACARAATSTFSDLGYVLESFDALGRFRTMEKVFDEQTGALRATLPIDTSAVPQVDRRRHAAGERPGRAESAHPRERQGRGLPVRELLPLSRCAAIRPRDSARRLRVRGDARQPRRSGGGAGRRVPRHRRQHRASAGERWVRHEDADRAAARGGCSCKGAGGAVLALPFLESLVPRRAARRRRRRRPSGSSCSSRSARSWSRSGTRASPATATRSRTASIQRQQGRRHDAAHAEAGQRQELHLGAARRLPDGDRHLRHPRPGAESVPRQADADPRPRFPALGEPQLRRPARQLLVVHGGHAVRRRQHRRRARPSTR